MSFLTTTWRLDLLVPLLAGHLLADFVLQTDRMAAYKDRIGVLLGHVVVVAVASWILIGHGLDVLPLILLVGLLHLLIDLAKGAVERRAFGEGRGSARQAAASDEGQEPVDDAQTSGFWTRNGRPFLFLGDQALHMLSLVATVAVIERVAFLSHPTPGTGLWIATFGAPYLRLLVLVSGWIVATTAAGYFFGYFLARFESQLEDDQKGGLSAGGYWIGVTERSLIYLFVLVGEPAGIGFLAAAKSVFRIGELRDSRDRKLAEYILIGTLISFATAMVVGLASRAAVSAIR